VAFVRRLATDVAFYAVLDVSQRAVGVLLVPIYTRVLSQREFGNFDLIVTVCSLLQVIVDLQQAQGFMRHYPEHLRRGTERRFVGTNLITRFVLGLAMMAVFIGLGNAGWLEFGFVPSYEAWKGSWIVAAATIPITLVMELLLLQTRLLGSKRLFAIGAVGNVLVSTVLCVILIAGLGWGVFGAVLGQCFGKLFGTGVLLWGLREHITYRCNWDSIRGVLVHALPIVPGYWITSFSVHVSRFFVFGELGAAEAAILAICMKVVSIVGLFSVSFRLAWQPLAMMSIGEEGSHHQFSEAMRVFLIGGLVSVCALSILAGPIVWILAPPSYAVAARYVGFFALASVISEVETSLQLGNQVAGKTFWLSLSAVLGIVVNVAILALFTRSLGIGAVVLGALVSSVLKAGFAYVTSQANHRVQYDTGAFVRFAVGCVVVSVMTALHGRIPAAVFAVAMGSTGLLLSWSSLSAYERRLARNVVMVGWRYQR
jgi:O-antigen/teichoic acid export membrane protein